MVAIGAILLIYISSELPTARDSRIGVLTHEQASSVGKLLAFDDENIGPEA